MAETVETTPTTTAEMAPSLEAMTSEQLSSWRTSGMPFPSEPKTSTPAAASSPAEPDVQAVSTETSPPAASEPATSTDKTPKARKTGEDRKAELHAEIQTLLKQRAELQAELTAPRQRQPDVHPPESSPAAPRELTLQDVLDRPDIAKPMLTEEEFYALPGATTMNAALYVARYQAAVDRQQSEQRAQQTAAEQAQTTREQAYVGRIKAAVSAGRLDVAAIDPRLLEIRPREYLPVGTKPSAEHEIASGILESEFAPELLAHFTEHPDAYDALLALPDPRSVVRALGRLEAQFDKPSMPLQPVVNLTTKAPQPGTSLGRKPASAPDDVSSALAEGNFARYRDEMNRRELARGR